jgi:hypothetical protein
MPDIENLDEHDIDTYDQYVGAIVQLSIGDKVQTGNVTGRKLGLDGVARGKASANPILDRRTYDVEFPDCRSEEYTANVIAENMYAQCDEEGNQFLMLQDIFGYNTDGHAVDRADMYIKVGSNRQIRKTTKGCHLCVEWKDGTTSWERLADLKESNPVEVAEYAATKSLHDDPAFAWWVPHVLNNRNIIIAAMTKRYHKRTHKFGIQVPKTWDEAVKLDEGNGNTLWQDAIRKEMNNVRIALKVLNDEEAIHPAYQEIRCHMIFDVKMEDFRRKARFVAGGHTTNAPHVMTYARVISRDSVRIALTLAVLNDLDVMMGDIENAYLTAPITEKFWTMLGYEFGDDAGKRALIVRALYGLKSAGAAFRNHLASCMDHLGWKPCLDYLDLWMKEETCPDDGVKYWAYILIYVDDILCVHHDPGTFLAQNDKYFKMKPGSIMEPTFYLGAKLKKTVRPNGVVAWGISSSKYVQAAVQNMQEYLKENGDRKLNKKASAPFEATYRAEIDESPVLGPEMANYFQCQIGILHWCVELGRIDIITEVSMFSTFLCMPREGHLDAVYHLFTYLSLHHTARVVFDPTYPDVDMRAFIKTDWKPMYGDVKEAIPPNSPVTRGKAIDLRLFVDSDHAEEHFTRLSRTGFAIYLNMAPTYCGFKCVWR